MGIHIYEKYLIVFFISLHKNDKLHTQNTHPWNDLNRLLPCRIISQEPSLYHTIGEKIN